MSAQQCHVGELRRGRDGWMVVGTVLAAAMVKPVDVATVGVVLGGLVSVAAFAVRLRRRRASQPRGGDAGGPGAAGGSADPPASASRGHDRWQHLMGGLEANLDAQRDSSPTTTFQRSTPPGAAASDRAGRPRVDAT